MAELKKQVREAEANHLKLTDCEMGWQFADEINASIEEAKKEFWFYFFAYMNDETEESKELEKLLQKWLGDSNE